MPDSPTATALSRSAPTDRNAFAAQEEPWLRKFNSWASLCEPSNEALALAAYDNWNKKVQSLIPAKQLLGKPPGRHLG